MYSYEIVPIMGRPSYFICIMFIGDDAVQLETFSSKENAIRRGEEWKKNGCKMDVA